MRELDKDHVLWGAPPKPDWCIDGEDYYADNFGFPIWDEEDLPLLRDDFFDVPLNLYV